MCHGSLVKSVAKLLRLSVSAQHSNSGAPFAPRSDWLEAVRITFPVACVLETKTASPGGAVSVGPHMNVKADASCQAVDSVIQISLTFKMENADNYATVLHLSRPRYMRCNKRPELIRLLILAHADFVFFHVLINQYPAFENNVQHV